MELSPEKRHFDEPPLRVTILEPGKIICCASAGAENEVVALLAFLGNLTTHNARITYEDEGTLNEIDQSELSMTVDDNPLDYDTYLRLRAEGLISARSFNLQLTPNPQNIK